MTTIIAKILVTDVKTDPKKGIYEISVVVAEREKIRSLIELNEQNPCFLLAGCSEEILLKLEDRKCEIQFVVSEALKPLIKFEEGEDILEYNEALSECKKVLFLVPSYDPGSQGIGVIKFKVNKKVIHTVYIKEVPVIQKGQEEQVYREDNSAKQQTEENVKKQSGVSQPLSELNDQKLTGNESDSSLGEIKRNASFKRSSSRASSGEMDGLKNVNSTMMESPLTDDDTLPASLSNLVVDNTVALSSLHVDSTDARCSGEDEEAGSIRVQTDYAQGNAEADEGLQAKPLPPRPSSQHSDDAPHQTTPVYESTDQGATAMDEEGQLSRLSSHKLSELSGESAYDKILSNKSLQVLAHVLPHGDAHSLSVYLGVPNSVFENFKKNHQHDIVSCHYQSLIHWRQERTSRRNSTTVGNQVLYEDLLKALGQTGRNDVKGVIERSFREKKQLEKHDFDYH